MDSDANMIWIDRNRYPKSHVRCSLFSSHRVIYRKERTLFLPRKTCQFKTKTLYIPHSHVKFSSKKQQYPLEKRTDSHEQRHTVGSQHNTTQDCRVFWCLFWWYEGDKTATFNGLVTVIWWVYLSGLFRSFVIYPCLIRFK